MGRLSDRVGVRIPILSGLTIMLLAILFLSAFAAGSPLSVVAVGMLGVDIWFACVNSPATNATTDVLEARRLGWGSGSTRASSSLAAGLARPSSVLFSRRVGRAERRP